MCTLLTAAVCVGAPVPKIIFDTDMVEDFDDVGALATLHAFADEGKCEILAMATCTRGNSSVAAVEIINHFYGRPEIPVGCTKEIGVIGTPSGKMAGHEKYLRLAKDYPEWVKHANSDDAPDANVIYRKALAAAPDRSVTFVSVGFTTNMRRLLETKPDAISPLDGRNLVAKKVVRWFAMACRYPSGKEYNAKNDAASSKIAFERWPTPIVFSDYNLGVDIYSGRTVAEREYGYRNPVKDIFAGALPPRAACRDGKKGGFGEGGRASWDEVTVFAAVRGIGNYFNTEKGTYRMIGEEGQDEWVPDEKSKHRRLVESAGKPRYNYPKWEIGMLVDELIAREPLCRRTDEAYRLHKAGKPPQGRTVQDGLKTRPIERLDRGLIVSLTARGTYLSWRLLDTDAPNAAFDVWRRKDGKVEKLNAAPIVQTTDFDIPGCFDAGAEYSVDGQMFVPVRGRIENGLVCIKFPLADTNATIGTIGLGDLDGDGSYDFVVKTPAGGNDPWDLVWKRREGTYRLEAYDAKGKFLWRKEMGQNLELGIWYSPYIVADLDGDGKAEVIAKTAPLEPDYRNPDGRVQSGPEFLSVLDGLTGSEICSTPWIPRAAPDHVDDYNHYASRNQIALAYLDGKTPCVVVERGTYGRMIVSAYRMKDRRLEPVWTFNNEFLPRLYRGQGDHACLCDDVDGDGFDEVLIGSLTIDHDGTPLWCNGRGHSDAHYFGDIDPYRPGMELFFVYETRQPKGGGLTMTDPATGKDIWILPTPTRHVHGSGICADIAPEYPGLECYGQEVDQSGNITSGKTHPQSDNRWFYTAAGMMLSSYTNCTYGYGNGVRNVFWDADLQREVFKGRTIRDHEGVALTPRCASPLLVADILGDWREEFLSVETGAFKLWITDIPAMDRRVTLMRDRPYRSRITMETSGYPQQPIMSYIPSAVSPNVSLRLQNYARQVRIDITAPLTAPLTGTLSLDMPSGWSVKLPQDRIDLKPGELWNRVLTIRRPPCPTGRFDLKATFVREGGLPPLVVHQPAVL